MNEEVMISAEDCKITPFDVVDYLDSEETCKRYLQIAFEENGLRGLQKALGDVARARSVTEIAEKSGLGRQNLYKALSANGNPSADTLLRVIKALGFDLRIV